MSEKQVKSTNNVCRRADGAVFTYTEVLAARADMTPGVQTRYTDGTTEFKAGIPDEPEAEVAAKPEAPKLEETPKLEDELANAEENPAPEAPATNTEDTTPEAEGTSENADSEDPTDDL
jgi:hypothetical protein